MVNTEVLLGELKRTAYVGGGVLASSFVGDSIQRLLPDRFADAGSLAIGGLQYAVGAGGAFYIQDNFNVSDTTGLNLDVFEAVQHVHYGVGGAGFAEAAESARPATQTGASVDEVVTVENNSTETTKPSQSTSSDAFSMDIA